MVAPTFPLNVLFKKRLADALRMQRDSIRALLNDPGRDASNFHLALAGAVRSMLCDAEWPTLLILAKDLSVDLRVWAPYPAGSQNAKPPTFAFKALVASPVPVRDGHELSATEFLDTPIGVVTVGPVEARQSHWYTPRQLIKWAANKEGPSHFDPQPPTSLANIGSSITVIGSVRMEIGGTSTPIAENDNLPVRMALLQIAQWAGAAADQVLRRLDESEAAATP